MLGHPGVCHSEIMRLAITILGSCRRKIDYSSWTVMQLRCQESCKPNEFMYIVYLFIVEEVSTKKNTKTAFSLRLSLRLGEVLLQELFSCSHRVHEFKWFDGQTRFIMIVSSCFEKQTPFWDVMIRTPAINKDQWSYRTLRRWHHVHCPFAPWSKDFDTNRSSWPTLCFPLLTKRVGCRELHEICTEHIGFQHLVQWNRSGTAHYNITSKTRQQCLSLQWCSNLKNHSMMILVLPGKLGKPTSHWPTRFPNLYTPDVNITKFLKSCNTKKKIAFQFHHLCRICFTRS